MAATKGVSAVAFRIIRSAVGIRYRRGEGSVEELTAEYTKLSAEQQAEIIAYYSSKEQ